MSAFDIRIRKAKADNPNFGEVTYKSPMKIPAWIAYTLHVWNPDTKAFVNRSVLVVRENGDTVSYTRREDTRGENRPRRDHRPTSDGLPRGDE